MKIIKEISNYIEDELCDAEKYVKKALEHKEQHPHLAQLYYNLSVEEIKHMQLLHNEVVRVIEVYRQEHGDPPKDMQAVYDYLHEKFIEKTKEIKVYQQMYSE